MARAQDKLTSLRFGRRESARLIAALLLSVLVHLGIWGGYHIGDKRGWWPKPLPPNTVHVTAARTRSGEVFVQPEAPPETYVDVSHADADAPVRTRFYSTKNSRAANPETGQSDVPKLDGTQTILPKTEDEPDHTKKLADAPIPVPEIPAPPRPAPSPLDFKMPPPQLARIEAPEPPQTPGETDVRTPAKTRPEALPAQPKSSPPAARPRTLRDALAQRDQLPGNKMQQEGGVRRHAEVSSIDAKATSFAKYDRAWIDAIASRWYDVTDRHPPDRAGRVIVAFKFKSDGTVFETRIIENTMGEMQGYLCQESIEEASPFGPWPPDMVRMYAANFIEIAFTFDYY